MMNSNKQLSEKLPQARLPRLKREIIELRNDPLKGVDVIIHDDITSMCLILTPLQGPFFGLRLHLTVKIPEEYPRIAPKVSIQTAVEHPNVFDDWDEYDGYICADILQSHARSSNGYNGGYTAGYLLKYIFLQLLSFFSDQWVEQDHGGLYKIEVDKSAAQRIVRCYSCTKCGYNKPTCSNPIKVVLIDDEIENQDIYGNRVSSSLSPTYVNSDVSTQTSDTTVNDLNDDAWLHILEFLTDQDIFLLSKAYPRISTLVSYFNIMLRRQLVCYYLRKNFTESVLGIGVRAGYGSVEKRELIIEEFDLFSYEAFKDHNLRVGIWGNKFTHFLPIALNQHHFDRSLPILKLSLMQLRDYSNWDPSIIFKTIPGIMSTIVVNLMKACDDSGAQSVSNRNLVVLKASEKALQGYCLLLHLLTMLAEKYPEITKEAENKITRFINSEKKVERHKSRTPNLGELMIYLFLCKNVVWSDFCPSFLQELLARNVVWFLNKEPGLAYIEPENYRSDYRLNATFELSNTSLRLVLFQVSFLKIIQGIGKDMKHRYGYPSDEMSTSLLLLIKQIYNVKTWDVFFKMIDFSLPERGWKHVITKMLKNAINESYNSGYHQVPYTINELYFIRLKKESQMPPPSCWNNDLEEVNRLLTYGCDKSLQFHPKNQHNTRQGNNQDYRHFRGGRGGQNRRGDGGRNEPGGNSYEEIAEAINATHFDIIRFALFVLISSGRESLLLATNKPI
ncbi:5311_t:CDS:2, partial [Scutellospora calospora]